MSSAKKNKNIFCFVFIPDAPTFDVMEPYEEAVQLLEDKQQLLEGQRKLIDDQILRIQNAVRVLRGQTVSSDDVKAVVDEVPVYVPTIPPPLSPVDRLIARYPHARQALSQDYNPIANWRDRVLYAIIVLGGSATVVQITEFICSKQSELEPDFVRRKTTRIASDLSAMHVVNAERDGTRNVYSI